MTNNAVPPISTQSTLKDEHVSTASPLLFPNDNNSGSVPCKFQDNPVSTLLNQEFPTGLFSSTFSKENLSKYEENLEDVLRSSLFVEETVEKAFQSQSNKEQLPKKIRNFFKVYFTFSEDKKLPVFFDVLLHKIKADLNNLDNNISPDIRAGVAFLKKIKLYLVSLKEKPSCQEDLALYDEIIFKTFDYDFLGLVDFMTDDVYQRYEAVKKNQIEQKELIPTINELFVRIKANENTFERPDADWSYNSRYVLLNKMAPYSWGSASANTPIQAVTDHLSHDVSSYWDTAAGAFADAGAAYCFYSFKNAANAHSMPKIRCTVLTHILEGMVARYKEMNKVPLTRKTTIQKADDSPSTNENSNERDYCGSSSSFDNSEEDDDWQSESNSISRGNNDSQDEHNLPFSVELENIQLVTLRKKHIDPEDGFIEKIKNKISTILNSGKTSSSQILSDMDAKITNSKNYRFVLNVDGERTLRGFFKNSQLESFIEQGDVQGLEKLLSNLKIRFKGKIESKNLFKFLISNVFVLDGENEKTADTFYGHLLQKVENLSPNKTQLIEKINTFFNEAYKSLGSNPDDMSLILSYQDKHFDDRKLFFDFLSDVLKALNSMDRHEVKRIFRHVQFVLASNNTLSSEDKLHFWEQIEANLNRQEKGKLKNLYTKRNANRSTAVIAFFTYCGYNLSKFFKLLDADSSSYVNFTLPVSVASYAIPSAMVPTIQFFSIGKTSTFLFVQETVKREIDLLSKKIALNAKGSTNPDGSVKVTSDSQKSKLEQIKLVENLVDILKNKKISLQDDSETGKTFIKIIEQLKTDYGINFNDISENYFCTLKDYCVYKENASLREALIYKLSPQDFNKFINKYCDIPDDIKREYEIFQSSILAPDIEKNTYEELACFKRFIDKKVSSKSSKDEILLYYMYYFNKKISQVPKDDKLYKQCVILFKTSIQSYKIFDSTLNVLNQNSATRTYLLCLFFRAVCWGAFGFIRSLFVSSSGLSFVGFSILGIGAIKALSFALGTAALVSPWGLFIVVGLFALGAILRFGGHLLSQSRLGHSFMNSSVMNKVLKIVDEFKIEGTQDPKNNKEAIDSDLLELESCHKIVDEYLNREKNEKDKGNLDLQELVNILGMKELYENYYEKCQNDEINLDYILTNLYESSKNSSVLKFKHAILAKVLIDAAKGSMTEIKEKEWLQKFAWASEFDFFMDFSESKSFKNMIRFGAGGATGSVLVTILSLFKDALVAVHPALYIGLVFVSSFISAGVSALCNYFGQPGFNLKHKNFDELHNSPYSKTLDKAFGF